MFFILNKSQNSWGSKVKENISWICNNFEGNLPVMHRFAGKLYFYYFSFVKTVVYLLFYPAFLFFLPKSKYQRFGHALRRKAARISFFLSGIKMEVISESEINPEKTYIICCNHFSEMDIIMACAGIKLYFGFLAKIELSEDKLLSIFFRTIDIAVDRGNNQQSVKVYKDSVKAIESGQSLLIFPEGGIFQNAPTLNPFKEGAFSLAVRHKIPVIPVCMPDNWKNFPDGKNFAKPGKIRLILHKPIETAHMQKEDMAGLQKQVFDVIKKDLLKG